MTALAILTIVMALVYWSGYDAGKRRSERMLIPVVANLLRELQGLQKERKAERAQSALETTQWLPILKRLRPAGAERIQLQANTDPGARN